MKSSSLSLSQNLFADDEEGDEQLLFSDAQDDSDDDSQVQTKAPWKVLVVDDDSDVHQITRLTLRAFSFEGRGLELHSVYSGEDARTALSGEHNFAVVLLDVVMESDDAGLQVVNYIRNELKDHNIRIIIRTGQPGLAPADKVYIEYDINDYIAKTELTANKLSWAVLGALRSYRDIVAAQELQLQLHQAEQDRHTAQAASKAKSQFLAHMSHEIRTPLNGVIGMLELLNQTELNEEQSYLTGIIDKSAHSLLNVVNDILDFKKIEAGKLALDEIRFSPQEMIDDARATFYASVHKNKQTLKTHISDNIPSFLIGDEIRIKQILINLIGNAIKFTPENGVISVNLDGYTEPHSQRYFFEMTVSDTGIGITEEQIQNLFSPFSQADTSTTREFGGTGLGLDISRQLAEMMGGGIKLTSKVGEGSTFSVSLKLGVEAHDSDQQNSSVDRSDISTSSLNILVAEDDPTNQKVIRAMLTRLGHEVEIVDTGAMVEGALQRQTFDLVMMDYHMPEMDGIEATKLLRSKEQYQDLPVVALTAATSTEERDNCLSAGMNDFLSKPYTLDALSKVLAKAMNK